MKTKEKTAIYKVFYTPKTGGEGEILVRARSAEQAIRNARNACFTGSDFRDPMVVNEKYLKPRKQGFGGRQ